MHKRSLNLFTYFFTPLLLKENMHQRSLTLIFALALALVSYAQHIIDIKSQPGERWWGGATALGSKMPFAKELSPFNLYNRNDNNQVSPLLISNKGRYLWSNQPFTFSVSQGNLHLDSPVAEIELKTGGSSLREAYLSAMREHFPPSGILPDSLFFTMPQYNTWIELMYNQNQKDVLTYAEDIVKNGFPPGIIMIDDNWQRHYGNFEFKPDRFPNPAYMVKRLHEMGFKVMLWVCPFVSADSPEYRDLAEKGYLLNDSTSQPAIIKWWNGQSAVYDFTNPQARQHFVTLLRDVQQRYGIDGFKFDGGDNHFYHRSDLVSYGGKRLASVEHTRAWAEIGLAFPFNEYRAGWQMGGKELVQRLGDKDYSWQAVRLLIPDMIAAGLLGYAYACPDMIGGGSFGTFLGIDASQFDQKLIVRSAQVHALMPMMQFSVAPWRILNPQHLQAVKAMAQLHATFGHYILQCARRSAATGEPIVQSLEYAYPHQGYIEIVDQWMLGDKYMVAPMVDAGNSRTVVLPPGKWKDDRGRVLKGGRTITIDVPLNRLPYYQKL